MRSDDALLLDMLIAAQNIQQFTRDLTRSDFDASKLVQSAVIREFQVIGEAARMITDETKTINVTIPWAVIAGMRNRLIHEYFTIRLKVVWDTIQNDLPPLIIELQKLIPKEDDSMSD
jgi:uncharacterized protein with HEPN domain